jgi:hypothetical protein
LYRHDKPNKPTKEGPLSFVLFESPIDFIFNSQQCPPLSGLSVQEMIHAIKQETRVLDIASPELHTLLSCNVYSVHGFQIYMAGDSDDNTFADMTG